jgi:hypothetical protein
MGFITQLLQLLFGPIGIIALLLGTWVIWGARASRRRWHWSLFGLCAFSASLAEYRDQYILDPPPLAFPLEQIRQNGRPLTILLLLLLIFLALQTERGWRKYNIPKPLIMLVYIQLTLLLKVLIEGSAVFALIGFITYTAVIFMTVRGPSLWLQDEQNFNFAVGSLIWVDVLFAGVVFYQFRINPEPMIFLHGLLMGMTGNPQHAAIMLMAIVPCILFFLLSSNSKFWQKILCTIFLLLTIYLLLQTGSRTGLLSLMVGVFIFFGQRSSAQKKFLYILALLAILVFTFIDISVASSFVPEKLISLQDTRTQVWQSMWQRFLLNPLFGAPLQGDRLGFNENSWLAIAATTGIIGLIPAILFAYQCIKFAMELHRIGNRNPSHRLHCDMVTAGISSLLVGSIAEAYLLGILTFALLALCTYLILGQYLIELDRKQRRTMAFPYTFPVLETGTS